MFVCKHILGYFKIKFAETSMVFRGKGRVMCLKTLHYTQNPKNPQPEIYSKAPRLTYKTVLIKRC